MKKFTSFMYVVLFSILLEGCCCGLFKAKPPTDNKKPDKEKPIECSRF